MNYSLYAWTASEETVCSRPIDLDAVCLFRRSRALGGGAYDPLVSFETKLGVWLLLWEVLGDLRRSGNYGDLLLGNCKYFYAFKVDKYLTVKVGKCSEICFK